MLTVAEIAARLGVSIWTVYRLLHAGHLPYERHRRSIRVSEQDLAAYRAAARGQQNAPASGATPAGA